MKRSTSKLRGRRAVAAVLLVVLLPLGLAPAASALDADGPPLSAAAGRSLIADLWDLLALVFLGGENRAGIDPDGATGEGDNRSQIDPDGAAGEGDNRGGIDPDGATGEGDNGSQIDPNG